MDASADFTLREHLTELLNSGIATSWEQRAYNREEIENVVRRLRQVATEDYTMRLKIAGFTSGAYRPPEDIELEQSCSTCMYFERNRQYCNLPELGLPVNPEWSCVLWRI